MASTNSSKNVTVIDRDAIGSGPVSVDLCPECAEKLILALTSGEPRRETLLSQVMNWVFVAGIVLVCIALGFLAVELLS